MYSHVCFTNKYLCAHVSGTEMPTGSFGTGELLVDTCKSLLVWD